MKILHHLCIQTENYKETLDFYTRVLGFKLVKESHDFHNRDFNTWVKLGDFSLEIQTPKSEDKLNSWSSKNAGIVHFAFISDNLEEEYKKIKASGYTNFKVKNGKELYEVEGGLIFKVKAPEGTEIEFRQDEIK